jgi:hypothetical protein
MKSTLNSYVYLASIVNSTIARPSCPAPSCPEIFAAAWSDNLIGLLADHFGMIANFSPILKDGGHLHEMEAALSDAAYALRRIQHAPALTGTENNTRLAVAIILEAIKQQFGDPAAASASASGPPPLPGHNDISNPVPDQSAPNLRNEYLNSQPTTMKPRLSTLTALAFLITFVIDEHPENDPSLAEINDAVENGDLVGFLAGRFRTFAHYSLFTPDSEYIQQIEEPLRDAASAMQHHGPGSNSGLSLALCIVLEAIQQQYCDVANPPPGTIPAPGTVILANGTRLAITLAQYPTPSFQCRVVPPNSDHL